MTSPRRLENERRTKNTTMEIIAAPKMRLIALFSVFQTAVAFVGPRIQKFHVNTDLSISEVDNPCPLLPAPHNSIECKFGKCPSFLNSMSIGFTFNAMYSRPICNGVILGEFINLRLHVFKF